MGAGDVSFIHGIISPIPRIALLIMTQTIGQKLKAVREEKRLTLEKVFEATRIRVPYLKALEDDDLSSMPSPVQARGYLRNYAEFLGLDFGQLVEEMRSAQQPSGEVVGPADLTDLSATHTPEPESVVQAPLSLPEPVSVTPAELQPEPSPAPEEIPASKPRATRRRKSDFRPQPASIPAPTKRRGRKKIEPEAEPVPEPQLEVAIEEPVPQPGPVVEEMAEIQPETPSVPDVSDSLWHTWLNRLETILSLRSKQKMESETEEAKLPEQPDSQPIQPEIAESEAAQPESPQPSAEIFKEIGDTLRSRRESLSLHLEEVERNTRVKAHYLEALEKGAMENLPSTVQTRGMLSNYATFLDLDVDTLLLRFADGLQARHRERNPQNPARKNGQPILASLPPARTFIAGDMVFGIGMAVLLVGFVIWGINRVLTLQGLRDIQPTAPSISNVLLASPDPSSFTATPTPLPVEAFPGEATATIIIPTVNVNVSVQVNLVAVERTFMRVIVDGKVVFDGRVVPGSAYPFEAEDQVEVLVGSGAAIRIVYNGRDLGLMGAFGQVVSNIYRADEIITPTALPSTTPTNTLSPTPTLRPTSTSRPTSTPIPSRTVSP
jgi:cytoskeletal protein RodZ